jgi:hypothetical protein
MNGIFIGTAAAEHAREPGLTHIAETDVEAVQQPTAYAEDVALSAQCDTIIAQFELVGPAGDAIKRRDELQLHFDTLVATDADLAALGEAGKELQAAIAVVAFQSLSEEDYLTLTKRYEALVRKVTDTGKDLLAAGQYDSVIALGNKLKQMQAAEQSELAMTCDAVAAQFVHVPALVNAIQARDALELELIDLKHDGSNIKAMVRVGNALKAAKAAVAQQLLSESDYLTLTGRHAALVQEVKDQCSRLAEAANYEALEALEVKLAELSVLSVQRGAQPGAAAEEVPDAVAQEEPTAAVVRDVPTAAVPQTRTVEAALNPPPMDFDPPAAAPALPLPGYAPSTAEVSPDWVDVGDTATTATSSSEDISTAGVDNLGRVAVVRQVPSPGKLLCTGQVGHCDFFVYPEAPR